MKQKKNKWNFPRNLKVFFLISTPNSFILLVVKSRVEMVVLKRLETVSHAKRGKQPYAKFSFSSIFFFLVFLSNLKTNLCYDSVYVPLTKFAGMSSWGGGGVKSLKLHRTRIKYFKHHLQRLQVRSLKSVEDEHLAEFETALLRHPTSSPASARCSHRHPI